MKDFGRILPGHGGLLDRSRRAALRAADDVLPAARTQTELAMSPRTHKRGAARCHGFDRSPDTRRAARRARALRADLARWRRTPQRTRRRSDVSSTCELIAVKSEQHRRELADARRRRRGDPRRRRRLGDAGARCRHRGERRARLRRTARDAGRTRRGQSASRSPTRSRSSRRRHSSRRFATRPVRSCCRSTPSTVRSISASRARPRSRGTPTSSGSCLPRPADRFVAGAWKTSRARDKEDALHHPTWSMGQKITIDSSTLMNKGLEVLEAAALFGIDVDRVDVVVHPQSIVHSMVEYVDGSVLAQLSRPDMRLPIAYCLGLPERLPHGYGAIDFTSSMELDVRAAGPRGVSRDQPRLRGGARRWRGARVVERRQRSRRRSVP